MSDKKQLLEEGIIRRMMALSGRSDKEVDNFLKESVKTGQIPFDSTDRRPDPRGESRLHEEEEKPEDKKPVVESEDKEETDTEESDTEETETEETPESETGDEGGELEVAEIGDEAPAAEPSSDDMGLGGMVDEETAKKVVEAVLNALGVQGEVSVGGDAGMGEEAPAEDPMGGTVDQGIPPAPPSPEQESLYEDRLVEAVARRVAQRLVKESKNKSLKEAIREKLQKKLTEKTVKKGKTLKEGEEPKAHPVGNAKPFEKTAKKEGIGAPFGKVGQETKGKKEGIGAPFNTKAPESSKHSKK